MYVVYLSIWKHLEPLQWILCFRHSMQSMHVLECMIYCMRISCYFARFDASRNETGFNASSESHYPYIDTIQRFNDSTRFRRILCILMRIAIWWDAIESFEYTVWMPLRWNIFDFLFVRGIVDDRGQCIRPSSVIANEMDSNRTYSCTLHIFHM